MLKRLRIRSVQYVDPCDDWLSTRLAAALERRGIAAAVLDDPHFLTPSSVIRDFTAGKKRLYFTEFYIAQRKRLGLLLEEDGKPVGGQWSFDPDNRKRLPKGIRIPTCAARSRRNPSARQGSTCGRIFPTRSARTRSSVTRPTTPAPRRGSTDFVRERLPSFGDYEDAISTAHDVLFHSVLTPMLNVGLLSPRQVVDAALAQAGRVPLNSLEGFVRQVIGWREFVRLVYLTHGRRATHPQLLGIHPRHPRRVLRRHARASIQSITSSGRCFAPGTAITSSG